MTSKKNIVRALLLSAMVALGFALAQTPTLAQTAPAAPAAQSGAQAHDAVASTDVCSALVLTGTAGGAQGPTATQPGFPDEGFDYTPPADQDLKPANPVQKSCEDGKIRIMVGSPREFGNRIADVVSVRVLILADDSVVIDLASLKQGIIGFNGNEFELARNNPITVRAQHKDGKTLYVIDLKLQTFVPKPGVVFNLDLRYATGLVPGSTTPDWKVLTTPDFVVTTSNTADNGEELLEGDLDKAGSPVPWLMWPLVSAGLFLVLLWPGLKFVFWLNRIRPGRKVPANEIAWKVFDKVIPDALENGFSEKHYKQIASALRRYLGVEPNTRLEVLDRLKDHPQIETITSALSKCDRVLYAGVKLSEAENRELVAEIKKLVPRPLSV
jgi:hypothetical protein